MLTRLCFLLFFFSSFFISLAFPVPFLPLSCSFFLVSFFPFLPSLFLHFCLSFVSYSNFHFPLSSFLSSRFTSFGPFCFSFLSALFLIYHFPGFSSPFLGTCTCLYFPFLSLSFSESFLLSYCLSCMANFCAGVIFKAYS